MYFQYLAWGLEYDRYSINSSRLNEQTTKQVFTDCCKPQSTSHLPAPSPLSNENWNEAKKSIASKLSIALILQWISHSEGALDRKSPPKPHQIFELEDLLKETVKSKWRRILPLSALFCPFWKFLPAAISKFHSSHPSVPLVYFNP